MLPRFLSLPKKLEQQIDDLKSVKFSSELAEELEKHKNAVDGRQVYWDQQACGVLRE